MKKTFDLAKKPSGYFSNPRPEMIKFIPRNAQKILEVGCGEGIFGFEMKKKLKAEVWGAEINESAGKAAGKKLDKIIIGDISTEVVSQLPDNYFDCVVFNDILEHLADPYSVLIKIKPKLSPKGVVVCSLPNIRFFYTFKALVLGKEWKYEDVGILDKTHLRFFTIKSIPEMFDSLGYEIEKIEGINPIEEIEGINSLKSWKYRIFNILSFGFFSDSRYCQIACVASPK